MIGHVQESERAVRDLLRRHGIRLHDSVIAELATAAERDRYREALERITRWWPDSDDMAWPWRPDITATMALDECSPKDAMDKVRAALIASRAPSEGGLDG